MCTDAYSIVSPPVDSPPITGTRVTRQGRLETRRKEYERVTRVPEYGPGGVENCKFREQLPTEAHNHSYNIGRIRAKIVYTVCRIFGDFFSKIRVHGL